MKQLGRYEIIEEIGRGGFATVYKARDTQLNRLVALKILNTSLSNDADFVRRFYQEAETAANFNHTNIVTIYDIGDIESQLFISMEYIPGRNLQEWLDKIGRPLTPAEALPILQPLASALDYAHQHGIVHRDIKPSNVMVDDTRDNLRVMDNLRIVLTDFGLVKAMEKSVYVTSTNRILGTPEYMAPEQADPNRQDEVGPHTDRYAFGILAYRMLVGRVPFPGNSISTLNAHVNMDVPPPQEINDALAVDVAAILLRMLAKSTAERYPTAQAFTMKLRTAVEAESRTQSLRSQVAPLYRQLKQAQSAADWVTVLTLAAQIETIYPGYRDVVQLQSEARQRLSELRPYSQSPVEQPVEEALLPDEQADIDPVSAALPASGIQKEQSAKDIGLVKKVLPKYFWGIGGVTGVVIACVILLVAGLLIVPGLIDGDATPTTTIEPHTPVAALTPALSPSDAPASPATATNSPQAPASEETIEDAPTLRPTLTPSMTPTRTPIPPTSTPTNVSAQPQPPPLATSTSVTGSLIPPLNPTRGSTWTRPSDNMVMVYVPAGTFLMGSDPEVDPNAQDDEQPQHDVTLDGFWIDQTEVTNEQFSQFVEANNFTTEAEVGGDAWVYTDEGWEKIEGADWQHPQGPTSDLSGLNNHPVVQVSWSDASAYCEWVGGQLPTEAQWEYAARGDDGRLYPWGNDSPTCNLAQYFGCSGDTVSIGSFSPAGDSWVGAVDMAGNVWEWVQDWYDSSYYENSPDTNPTGPDTGESKVLRGGSWNHDAADVRSAYRNGYAPSVSGSLFGFRCAAPGP